MTHPAGPPAAPAVCVRHPDRPTGLSCTRCGRPACPECLREAAVGYQCVDCVAEGRRSVRTGTTVAGARPARGRPRVTAALIGLNLLVFAGCIVQARSIMGVTGSELFYRFALVPGFVAEGEWWRVVTSGFLHFGLVHIALNMLALWMLGVQLEPVLGRWRFLAIYLISLVGASAACMLFYPAGGVVAGASGAVFGLLGAFLVVLIRMRLPVSVILPTILINIVISVVVPGISLIAHLGGALAGAAATAAVVYTPRSGRTALQAALLGGLGGLVVVLSVLGAARFF
ncbi:rhomboid family intramembrane serine protease [Pseudonocardia thermophila]|uniref:rhomboid family intramembrane serine protease n=1 Tax=Pseudonocardia thermophila TaxID=1848 RepID=UPI00248E693C|nr:rhomboid family intramembrane serine protease [Pseudonocardia thermophila]